MEESVFERKGFELMDVLDRLIEMVNSTGKYPLPLKKGYLSEKESFVIYPLPGSKDTQVYMDGTKDSDLLFELAMKSKDGEQLERTLWMIQNQLDNLNEMKSKTNSFEFDKLTINSKPYINSADEQGWLVFLLDITISITTLKEETTHGI